MVPNIAVILTDNHRKIIWVNEDFTEITGYALHEVLGKKPSILQGRDSEQEVVERMRSCLESGISIREQLTNYRKNGEKYICKLVIHPIYNESNEITNFIAFEVDGSKIKDESKLPHFYQTEQKYLTSSLRISEEGRLFERLKRSLKEEQLYLDPKLKLKKVADQLSTNTKYLSQVVNHQTNMNFQTYVNTYRVEDAKKMILSGDFDNLTFYGIALQCGFKNKSTFYKVFKEITGYTPKEYHKINKTP